MRPLAGSGSRSYHRAAEFRPIDEKTPMPELSARPDPPRVRSSMTFYWPLVLAPVWWLMLDVAAYRWVGSEYWVVADAVTVGIMTLLVLMDSSALAKAGVRVSAWWGILLFPLYLVVRTKRAQSTWALPITWLFLSIAYQAAYEPILAAIS